MTTRANLCAFTHTYFEDNLSRGMSRTLDDTPTAIRQTDSQTGTDGQKKPVTEFVRSYNKCLRKSIYLLIYSHRNVSSSDRFGRN